jgi:AcrR family transcriptional regulator
MPRTAKVRATALERAQQSPAATPRPVPTDALNAARRLWLAGERIDMQALAEELGVSRATLYIWVGSREKLIGEVLWSFADAGLRQARAAARGSGAAFVLDVFRRFIHANAGFAPLRRFIEQDPELALRVLTSKSSPVQGRMIESARALLAEQVAAGDFAPALPVGTLAYTVIRVAESFLYSDLIAGSEPDVERAVQVVQVLVGEAPPAAHTKRRKPAKRR